MSSTQTESASVLEPSLDGSIGLVLARPTWPACIVAALIGCSLDGSTSLQASNSAAPLPRRQPEAPLSSLPRPPSGPATSADGATVAQPPRPDGARVYARSRFVWVWPEPDVTTQWIGFLWLGGSARLRSPEPLVGNGCAKFVAVEPRGYVCVDGRKATLDPNDPYLAAVRDYAPQVDSPWPHRYGESLGLVRYATLPDEAMQRAKEGDLANHLARIEKARSGEVPADLQGIDFSPATAPPIRFPAPPNGMYEPLELLRPRSTVAFSTDALAYGRSWLLTADLRWVPKDRVKPYPKITFEGVHLNDDTHLPLAFFRKKARAQYERSESGTFTDTGKTYPRLSWVALSGRSERVAPEDAAVDAASITYLETTDSHWIREDDAVVPTPQPETPWGAKIGAPDTSTEAPKGRRTWIEVSVLGGWLIAYEDTTPVFVTMISPGRGGVPAKGRPPLETSATPTGRFSITGKFKTATMEAPGEYIHSDVPWAQNFVGPYAIHTAYWHDDWGQLKSGGCINVSPKDGVWLFGFTEPPIPPGWHGVRWLPYLEPATTLIVHR